MSMQVFQLRRLKKQIKKYKLVYGAINVRSYIELGLLRNKELKESLNIGFRI